MIITKKTIAVTTGIAIVLAAGVLVAFVFIPKISDPPESGDYSIHQGQSQVLDKKISDIYNDKNLTDEQKQEKIDKIIEEAKKERDKNGNREEAIVVTVNVKESESVPSGSDTPRNEDRPEGPSAATAERKEN
ncbi:MAG: DUF148 domain-containing protein [Candidatus Nomurabacteria bacterium]|jgi:hypothetical protein|nr:DUF148 domain-containing protein [Candidatus Nomurabacteria bacterium]